MQYVQSECPKCKCNNQPCVYFNISKLHIRTICLVHESVYCFGNDPGSELAYVLVLYTQTWVGFAQTFWKSISANDEILTRSDLLNNIRHTILVVTLKFFVSTTSSAMSRQYLYKSKYRLLVYARDKELYLHVPFIAMLWLVSYANDKIDKIDHENELVFRSGKEKKNLCFGIVEKKYFKYKNSRRHLANLNESRW